MSWIKVLLHIILFIKYFIPIIIHNIENNIKITETVLPVLACKTLIIIFMFFFKFPEMFLIILHYI